MDICGKIITSLFGLNGGLINDSYDLALDGVVIIDLKDCPQNINELMLSNTDLINLKCCPQNFEKLHSDDNECSKRLCAYLHLIPEY